MTRKGISSLRMTGGLIPELLESASVVREATGEFAGETHGEPEELNAPLLQESSQTAVLNTNADYLGSALVADFMW